MHGWTDVNKGHSPPADKGHNAPTKIQEGDRVPRASTAPSRRHLQDLA